MIHNHSITNSIFFTNINYFFPIIPRPTLRNAGRFIEDYDWQQSQIYGAGR